MYLVSQVRYHTTCCPPLGGCIWSVRWDIILHSVHPWADVSGQSGEISHYILSIPGGMYLVSQVRYHTTFCPYLEEEEGVLLHLHLHSVHTWGWCIWSIRWDITLHPVHTWGGFFNFFRLDRIYISYPKYSRCWQQRQGDANGRHSGMRILLLMQY